MLKMSKIAVSDFHALPVGLFKNIIYLDMFSLLQCHRFAGDIYK